MTRSTAISMAKFFRYLRLLTTKNLSRNLNALDRVWLIGK